MSPRGKTEVEEAGEGPSPVISISPGESSAGSEAEAGDVQPSLRGKSSGSRRGGRGRGRARGGQPASGGGRGGAKGGKSSVRGKPGSRTRGTRRSIKGATSISKGRGGPSGSRGRGRSKVGQSQAMVPASPSVQALVPFVGSPPPSSPAISISIPSTPTSGAAEGLLALPAPPPQPADPPVNSPEFYRQLVDNWEYTSALEIGGDVALPAFQEHLRNEFWHYVQQFAGKWLLVAVELEAAPEENSKSILFKLCHCAVKRKKMIKETFATVRLVTRPTDPYSSYWLHIENHQLANVQGVTLKTLKMACETAFGTILVRRPASSRPSMAQGVEMELRRMITEMKMKLEAQGEEQRSLELFASETDD